MSEELDMGSIMGMTMGMVMLVIVTGVLQILPQPKGQLTIVSLELS